jgi:hypothetical protein
LVCLVYIILDPGNVKTQELSLAALLRLVLFMYEGGGIKYPDTLEKHQNRYITNDT